MGQLKLPTSGNVYVDTSLVIQRKFGLRFSAPLGLFPCFFYPELTLI